jgi:hypothetical protein
MVHRMGGDLEGEGGVIVATTISRVQLLGSLAVLARLAGEEGSQCLAGLFGAAEVPALVACACYGRQIKAQIVCRLPWREIGCVRLQGRYAGVLHAFHDDDALRRGHYGDILSEHSDVPAVVHMSMRSTGMRSGR